MAIGWEEFWEYVEGASQVLKMIVEYSIFDGPDMCSRRELCEMRLRNKSWNATVSKILEERRVPLYAVKMTGQNSLSSSPLVREHGKRLDNFIRFMKSLPPTAPLRTFQLIVEREAVADESYDSLSKLFSSCGKHLQKLEFMNIPGNGERLPGAFPGLWLPALRSLECNVDHYDVWEESEGHGITRLIESLVQGAVALETLKVKGIELLPGFPPLALPPTLTRLCLEEVTEENLKLLQRSDLPKLTHLELHFVGDRVPPAELLFRLLRKFGTHLRRLSLHPRSIDALDHSIHWELPPVMTALQRFDCGFPLQRLSLRLGARMPQLTTLRLVNQDPEQLSLWINQVSVPLLGVTDLSLMFRHGPLQPELPLTLELAQGAAHTFPNLTRFHFGAQVTDGIVFNYIFGKMRNLSELEINGLPSQDKEVTWDSLFMGFTKILAKDLYKYRGPNATHHRISKMTELKDIRINWGGVVRGTRFSDEVVARFQAMLPKLKVFQETGVIERRRFFGLSRVTVCLRRSIGGNNEVLAQDWEDEEEENWEDDAMDVEEEPEEMGAMDADGWDILEDMEEEVEDVP